jgi:hypothetical protein
LTLLTQTTSALKTLRAVLALVLISLTGLQLSILVVAECRSVIWSASFEAGDQSEFNGGVEQVGGANATVSSSIRYNGDYSGYYYYVGPWRGADHHDSYPLEYISGVKVPNFLVQLWVYVPSRVSGQSVTITDWVSFATIWVNEGAWRYALPITVDGARAGGWAGPELLLIPHMLGENQSGIIQTNPLQWPFDKWFKIGIEVDLRPGTANSNITVYQDDLAVISWTGDLGNKGLSGPVTFDGLSGMHFGLYTGWGQGTFAVYNDAITLQASGIGCTVTMTVTGTTTKTITSYQVADLSSVALTAISLCLAAVLAVTVHRIAARKTQGIRRSARTKG